MEEFVKEYKVYAFAVDPIYIGTGGYKLGKVDNTIVRDPTTRLPKIPGSSLAGVWRYYSALFLLNKIKDEYRVNLKSRKEKKLYEIIEDESYKNYIHFIDNNFNSLDSSFKDFLKDFPFWFATEGNQVIDFLKELAKENSYLKQKFDLPDIIYDSNQDNLKIKDFSFKITLSDNNICKISLLNDINKEISFTLKSNGSINIKVDNDSSDISNISLLFPGNRYVKIKCAGQDDSPNIPYDSISLEDDLKTGHCGRCIVCRSFGFTKNDISWQGLVFFSDLKILFFPVFTMEGTKWITTKKILKEAGLASLDSQKDQDDYTNEKKVNVVTINSNESYINLGWLYLPYTLDDAKNYIDLQFIDSNGNIKISKKFDLNIKDIVIVPEDLFSHIVNSNLEVRTSVSIDPITGASKEGALFTSEAIPRGTIFYGEVRIFDKKSFEKTVENRLRPLPSNKQILNLLENSTVFFETLGIGGMTTRGFGRIKLLIIEKIS